MMKPLYRLAILSLLPFTSLAQPMQLVRDINSGSGSSQPAALTSFGNSLYFTADNGGNGRELWRFDGAQTNIVTDLSVGAGSGVPQSIGQPTRMAVLNGVLYFAGTPDTTGTNPYVGTELMAFSGASRPTIAADIIPGTSSSFPEGLLSFNGKLYFSARQQSGSGNELYMFSGMGSATMVDINAGTGASNPQHFTVFRNKIYFSAEVGAGRELYVYDPVSGTHALVNDINSGSGSSSPQSFVATSTALYFTATTTANGRELYRYDGTTVNRLTDIAAGSANGIENGGLAIVGDHLFFAGAADGGAYQPYQYSISGNTAALISTINPNGSATPFGFTAYNGRVYFTAFAPGSGYELFSTDAGSATMVSDINPGGLGSTPTAFYEHNGQLYFTALNAATGAELYRYTGATGIQHLAFAGSAKAYPVPSVGDVQLSLKLEKAANLSVSIADLTGRTVWTHSFRDLALGNHTLVLPLAGFTAGTYYYQLLDEAGNMVGAGKLIKQ